MRARFLAPVAVVASILIGAACGTAPPVPVSHHSVLEPPPVAAASGTQESSETPAASASADVEEPPPVAAVPPKPPAPVCNPQQAFDWLNRQSYIPVKTKKKEHERALKFRTETYGRVKGYGDASWNTTLARDAAVDVTVFGLPVRVHQKIVPALRCVEAEIKSACGAMPYTPGVLAGIRDKNTYRAGEVTNHLWGIALDIDPLLNSCCGCVKKWQQSPLCKKKAKTIWERMSMPKCWVDAFEKYGFYWLGHDTLKDTMHFEFLADPDKIMVTPPVNVAVLTSSME